MHQAQQHVVDASGVRHELGRVLGKGGQGTVYEVPGQRAVKLVSDVSRVRRERLQERLAFVRRLPLDGLEIARPLQLLRAPQVGYVMDLVTGMVPLATLAVVPHEERNPVSWYQSGGGLRRRLRLLARAGDILQALHGKGLVYADPSPQNVFVSEDRQRDYVRLIDADNLRYRATVEDPGVFTPLYGAPELVTGKGLVTSLS